MVASSVFKRGRQLTIRARAKVNLGLDVLGRRPDGYHELLTLLTAIDVADRVTLEATAEGIEVQCDAPGVPSGSENLAWRAAELLRREAGVRVGVRIGITKAIPVAAGLGGGSADAAAVLVGLNRLWGLALPPERLHALAIQLGTDVPFFLGDGPALASGRGDQLAVVPLERMLPLVVVNPGFPLATREVYARVRPEHCGSGAGVRAVVAALSDGAPAVAARLRNGLEAVVGGLWPGLAEVKAALAGAGALGSIMSGSGPTVIGLARSRAAATAIRDAISPRSWRTWVTHTVRGPALSIGWREPGPARKARVQSWGVAKR